MTKEYGKRPRKTTARKAAKKKAADGKSLKIRLKGKDGAPLEMSEVQQGFYDIDRKLKALQKQGYRAKYATVYLTFVDERGEEVVVDDKGEWVIYPYQSAADEHGV